MNRKKILCMTDSAKLHTGFAKVGKEIFTHLVRTKKYEVVSVGWFHQNTSEGIIYPIWHTRTNEKGVLLQEDKYAHQSLPEFIDKFKPDIVWTLGDMWMTDHVAALKSRKTFKWIGYFPIDGEPVPSKWGKTVENMDVAVAYGEYGMKVIKSIAPKANLKYIYHGVDTDIFKPETVKTRASHRERLLGVKDKKVIGIVARNQPRKAFDKLFEMYFYVLNGKYIVCNKCGTTTVHPYRAVTRSFTYLNKCRKCLSKDVSSGTPREDVLLYVHAAAADCGWDLIDLQNDFNLNGKVLINPDLKIGIGVSDNTLSAIYNSMDIFTLPTRGEGFGLPILEAMACGVPIVVTNYSAHPEWATGAGEMIDPVVLESEPLTNIRRAIINMDDYVGSIIKLLDKPELRDLYGSAGVAIARKMEWKIIVKQWEELIDNIAYGDDVPELLDSASVNYNLEEV